MSDIYTMRFTEYAEPGGTLYPDNRAIGTYNTGWLDMRAHQRAVFLLAVGVIAQAGTVDFELRQATTSDGDDDTNYFPEAGYINITQLTQAGGDGNDLIALEVRTEQMDVDAGFRYLSGRLTIAGGAAYTAVVPLRTAANYPPVPTTNWTEIITT
jgi:hypothetical protein